DRLELPQGVGDDLDLGVDLPNRPAEVIAGPPPQIDRKAPPVYQQILDRAAISESHVGVDNSLDGGVHVPHPRIQNPLAKMPANGPSPTPNKLPKVLRNVPRAAAAHTNFRRL